MKILLSRKDYTVHFSQKLRRDAKIIEELGVQRGQRIAIHPLRRSSAYKSANYGNGAEGLDSNSPLYVV